MKRFGFLFGVAMPALALVAAGCSSASTGATGDISMENLPASTEFLSSGASASVAGELRLASIDADTVTSARDLMDAIDSDAITALDLYFSPGGNTLATINGLGSVPSNSSGDVYRNNFFKFQNQCFVMGSILQSYSELEGGATSACYVQGMARLYDEAAKALRQEASDKLVKILPRNMPDEGGGDDGGEFGVFIKVVGSNSGLEDGEYKLEFSFCTNGEVDGQETLSFNVKTGAYTSSSSNVNDGGSQTFVGTLTATAVEQEDGNYAFVGDRTFVGHGGGTWGNFKTSIGIDDAGLLTIMQRHSDSGGSFSGKQYVKANIVGTSFKADADDPVKILEAGFAGLHQGSNWEHDNFGAFEFNSTSTPRYSGVTTGDLYTEMATFMGADHDGFDDETFFSGTLSAPTVSLDFDCTQEPDETIDMNFETPEVSALREKCERSFRDARICDGDDVQSIQNKVFTSFGGP